MEEGRLKFNNINKEHIHTTSFVLNHFKSISMFANDLELYLANNTYNYHNRWSDENHENLENSDLKNSTEATTATITLEDGPRVPLDVLFGVFKRSVKYEKDSLYKIGDLQEKQLQSIVIADLKLSFKDRYLFCLASVNIDHERLRSIIYSISLPLFHSFSFLYVLNFITIFNRGFS